MIAILTHYLGPTNYRGARIVAAVPARVAECYRHDHMRYGCEDGPEAAENAEHRESYRPGHWRLTVSYDYALSGESAHRAAAERLRDRLGWSGHLIAGATDDGYAYVFGPDADMTAARAILARHDGTGAS